MSDAKLKTVSTNSDNENTDESSVEYHKLIPNIITLMSLAAGLSAMQFAIDGSWERAVIAIVIAAVLDTLEAHN